MSQGLPAPRAASRADLLEKVATGSNCVPLCGCLGLTVGGGQHGQGFLPKLASQPHPTGADPCVCVWAVLRELCILLETFWWCSPEWLL